MTTTPTALPGSGQISLNQIHGEAGGASGVQCSINDADIRDMIGKGSGVTASFADYHGATSAYLKIPGDPAVFGEWRNDRNQSYGSVSSMGSDWSWSMGASSSSKTIGTQLSSALLGTGTYTCDYDITVNSGSEGMGVYLSWAQYKNAGNQLTGFGNYGQSATQETQIITCSTWPSPSKASNQNGTMTQFASNTGGTGRASGSFQFTLGTNVQYQIGIWAQGFAGGGHSPLNSSVTIHSLTIS